MTWPRGELIGALSPNNTEGTLSSPWYLWQGRAETHQVDIGSDIFSFICCIIFHVYRLSRLLISNFCPLQEFPHFAVASTG